MRYTCPYPELFGSIFFALRWSYMGYFRHWWLFWVSADVEVNGRVTTGKCSLDFFRGGSKVKVNIGTIQSGT